MKKKTQWLGSLLSLVCAGLVAVVAHHHVRAFFCQDSRNGCADPAGGAGNKSYFIGQLEVHTNHFRQGGARWTNR